MTSLTCDQALFLFHVVRTVELSKSKKPNFSERRHERTWAKLIAGYDITRIWIGYVLSDVLFHWLVENMSVYQENLFQSRSKKPAFSFIYRSIFQIYCIKAIETRGVCVEVLVTVSNFPNFPSCLDEAM